MIEGEPVVLADRYELIEALGTGSFAQTWRAKDRENTRVVAVKILDSRSADWKARELFEREAAVLRSLRHPGIPEVFDAFRAPWGGVECSCLAMEYVEGTSLAAVIESPQRLNTGDASALFLGLLGIVDYIHTRVPPVVHRDIKPSNIILRPDGASTLVDFGSAREGFAGAADAGSTVAGTYGYMPYEQYMGQASPSSDLYALGATMLHLLTGRPPRDFVNAEGRIAVPDEVAGGAHLRTVLARMLMSSPAERYASAREVELALMTPAGMQVVPATGAAPTSLAGGPARRVAPLVVLPPAPREITGATREQFDRVAYGMWQMMDAGEKRTGPASLAEISGFVFLSLVTAGILPLVFYGLSRKRRRRSELFFREGVLTSATITELATVKPAFDVPLGRVFYEFGVDGVLHRDADTVLPSISNRWRVGDTIQVLFIPARGYDSIIVSSE